MLIDFKGLLEGMEDDDIFVLANEARPGDNYLFNGVLPNRNRRGYHAKAGSMSIRATMAKFVGMDSKYPRGGAARRSSFEHRLAKMAIEMPFPEEYLRELRETVNDAFNNTDDDHEVIVETMFNFTEKLLVQPMLDTEEWTKGQALTTGVLQVSTDAIEFEVDYGIPDENFLPARTGSEAYGGADSKFWDDWHEAQRILKWRVQVVMMRTTTLEVIMYNPNNDIKLEAIDRDNGVYVFRRWVLRDGIPVVSEDPRDAITIVTYDDEGEVLDESAPGTGKTVTVPFIADGALLFIGRNDGREFTIGSGSTDEPETSVRVGYTHVGPTEEGNGRLGRWATAYVPQGEEYMFTAKTAENFLPVIERPDLLVNATTEI